MSLCGYCGNHYWPYIMPQRHTYWLSSWYENVYCYIVKYILLLAVYVSDCGFWLVKLEKCSDKTALKFRVEKIERMALISANLLLYNLRLTVRRSLILDSYLPSSTFSFYFNMYVHIGTRWFHFTWAEGFSQSADMNFVHSSMFPSSRSLPRFTIAFAWK